MKQIILPVTVHLNIRLPLALLQPEPADAPTGPEPEAHACQGCGGCGNLGGGRAEEMYRPYIEGKRELREINESYRANFVRG